MGFYCPILNLQGCKLDDKVFTSTFNTAGHNHIHIAPDAKKFIHVANDRFTIFYIETDKIIHYNIMSCDQIPQWSPNSDKIVLYNPRGSYYVNVFDILTNEMKGYYVNGHAKHVNWHSDNVKIIISSGDSTYTGKEGKCDNYIGELNTLTGKYMNYHTFNYNSKIKCLYINYLHGVNNAIVFGMMTDKNYSHNVLSLTGWNDKIHRYESETNKKTIMTLMCVANRIDPKLPNELWLIIFKYLMDSSL